MAVDAVAQLDSRPGSIRPKQLQLIWLLGRKRHMDPQDIRDAAGGSVSALSCEQASVLIQQLGGGELPNEPGQAPPPPKRKRTPGTVRMISGELEEQCTNLLMKAFEYDTERAYAWLLKDFKVERVRDLATAQRAGELVYVLKTMIARKDEEKKE